VLTSFLDGSLHHVTNYCKIFVVQNKPITPTHKIAYLDKKEVQFMLKIRKGYDSESKTFRLPIELIEKLEVLATQNKLSLNQLVIQCLDYAVDNIEVKKDES